MRIPMAKKYKLPEFELSQVRFQGLYVVVMFDRATLRLTYRNLVLPLLLRLAFESKLLSREYARLGRVAPGRPHGYLPNGITRE